jgi:IclR family acetate operon transcriptional repressor
VSRSVGTLARGLDVLELFPRLGPELTQKQISSELGLAMPTVHRLTSALGERGYLVRDERTRAFRLGMEVARLLPPLLSGMQLPDLAREHLRALADETGETVNLAVLSGGDVVYLASETGGNLLTPRTAVGMRLPAHCTALGKCLLAQLDDADARAAAGREPYRRLTRRTRTTWKGLAGELHRVRESGIAVSDEEYEIGLASLAVPLRPPAERGPAAINVSLPVSRATAEARERIAAGLRRAADAIAAAAGAAAISSAGR